MCSLAVKMHFRSSRQPSSHFPFAILWVEMRLFKVIQIMIFPLFMKGSWFIFLKTSFLLKIWTPTQLDYNLKIRICHTSFVLPLQMLFHYMLLKEKSYCTQILTQNAQKLNCYPMMPVMVLKLMRNSLSLGLPLSIWLTAFGLTSKFTPSSFESQNGLYQYSKSSHGGIAYAYLLFVQTLFFLIAEEKSIDEKVIVESCLLMIDELTAKAHYQQTEFLSGLMLILSRSCSLKSNRYF